MHDEKGREEGYGRPDREPRKVRHVQHLAGLPEVVDRGAEDGRDRKEEGEFRRGLSREPQNKAPDDGRARTARPRNHREALAEAHGERVLPRHVVHRRDARDDPEALLTVFNPQNEEPAHDERHGDRHGVEEIGLDEARHEHADHGRGQKGHDRVDGEALLLGFRKEALEDRENAGAVVPADGQNRSRLNRDHEGVSPRRLGESHRVRGDDQVPRRADGQKLRQAFDDAEHGRLKPIKPIHACLLSGEALSKPVMLAESAQPTRWRPFPFCIRAVTLLRCFDFSFRTDVSHDHDALAL